MLMRFEINYNKTKYQQQIMARASHVSSYESVLTQSRRFFRRKEVQLIRLVSFRYIVCIGFVWIALTTNHVLHAKKNAKRTPSGLKHIYEIFLLLYSCTIQYHFFLLFRFVFMFFFSSSVLFCFNRYNISCVKCQYLFSATQNLFFCVVAALSFLRFLCFW